MIIEITDEIVDRYLVAMGVCNVAEGSRKAVKAALEAALNPPAERPVSREQTKAGLDAYYTDVPKADKYTFKGHADMASAYCAMLKLEDCEPTAAEMKAAIQVAWNTYAASGVGWKERIEAALRAALKIRFGRE